MSLFGPSAKYSRDKHQLTAEDLKRILWHVHLASISETNKQAVQQAVLGRRVEGDKISLQTIYETLTKMKDQNQITKSDREQFMKIFQEYFTQHFGA
jgi:DNA-binding PadR family transcriptional regulator